MGMKDQKRAEMYQLSAERKKYLVRQFRSSTYSRASKPVSPPATQGSYPASYGSANAAAILPRLVPQLTGDSGIMKRFSIASWTSASPQAGADQPGPSRRNSILSSPEAKGDSSPTIQPQSTGGLWGSWWASSGGDDKSKEPNSVESYISRLRSARIDMKLVKHLISLRVHLSTANLVWIEEFLAEGAGMEVMGQILTSLVSKGGKRRKLTDIESSVLLETVKCLRVLLNTEASIIIWRIQRDYCYPNPWNPSAWFQQSVGFTHNRYAHRLFSA
jgi:diaphanous 1